MKKQTKKSAIPKLFAFRIVLGIVIFGYITIGIAAIIGGDTALNTINTFYGASINLTPQVTHIIRILGAFMIGVGIIGIFAWNNPIKNKAITNGIIILLLIRVAEKLIYFNDIQQAFNVSSFRLISGAILFFLLALLLYLFKPK